MSEKFRQWSGGMPLWAPFLVAAIVIGLLVLREVFNDWVYFAAFAVVVVASVVVLRSRNNRDSEPCESE